MKELWHGSLILFLSLGSLDDSLLVRKRLVLEGSRAILFCPNSSPERQTNLVQSSSVKFSCSVTSDSLRPHGLQHTRLPCPSPTPDLVQTHVRWVGDAIQPSHPLSSSSPPAFNLSQHQGLFNWVSSSHQVAKVLEFQLQHQSLKWISRTDFLENWLVESLCNPRDSQESSTTPQFKSINSSALSFLYSPNLTSIHNYWKNHSFD